MFRTGVVVKQVKHVAALMALLVVALTGCGGDRPGDRVAEPALRQQAETDLLEGLEIADFKRANGQVDPDSANRYRITYSYRLQLTRPYAEVILAAAENLHAELAGSARKAQSSAFDLSGLEDTLTHWQLSLAANEWVNNQADAFVARRDRLVGGCESCLEFWNSADAPEQAELRRMAFIIAWRHMESLAFSDEAKVGDGVERYVWRTFEKTEKGWMPSAL